MFLSIPLSHECNLPPFPHYEQGNLKLSILQKIIDPFINLMKAMNCLPRKMCACYMYAHAHKHTHRSARYFQVKTFCINDKCRGYLVS